MMDDENAMQAIKPRAIDLDSTPSKRKQIINSDLLVKNNMACFL